MTDLQFKAFLKSILEILESSKDLEDAKSKIKALLNEVQQSLSKNFWRVATLSVTLSKKIISNNLKKDKENKTWRK